MTGPPTGHDPVRALVPYLRQLTHTGIRSRTDVINAVGIGPLIDRIHPPRQPGDVYTRADSVIGLVTAAIDALKPPRADALRELFAIPTEGAAPLTLTGRRENAAQHYGRIQGDSWRKTHEDRLLFALAGEIDRRTRHHQPSQHTQPGRRGSPRNAPRPLPVLPVQVRPVLAPILLNAPNAPRHLGPTDDGHQGIPATPPPPWPAP